MWPFKTMGERKWTTAQKAFRQVRPCVCGAEKFRMSRNFDDAAICGGCGLVYVISRVEEPRLAVSDEVDSCKGQNQRV